MSSDEPIDRGLIRVPQATAHHDDDPAAWSSGEWLRLIIAPSLATLLLVGGVYWVRLQLPAGPAGQQQAAIMQVQLLPRAAAPTIPMPASAQSSADEVVSRADVTEAEPTPTSAEVAARPARIRAFEPAELPPPSISAMPAKLNGPANVAAIRFQQILLQHVARYQRYPNAGIGQKLEGRVDAQFSMARDGTVLGIWVKTSSGQQLLDKEAIETIRRAQPLPPIPPGLPDRLNIHVQLVFEPA